MYLNELRLVLDYVDAFHFPSVDAMDFNVCGTIVEKKSLSCIIHSYSGVNSRCDCCSSTLNKILYNGVIHLHPTPKILSMSVYDDSL